MAKKRYPSYWLEKFIEAAGRLAWADWWAREQEERGRSFSGKDIYDEAPATPEYARVWAGMLVGRLEEKNGTSIYVIAAAAWKAEHKDEGFADPEKFGVALAFMALGHGVSWFDDHERFPLKVPYMEFDAG